MAERGHDGAGMTARGSRVAPPLHLILSVAETMMMTTTPTATVASTTVDMMGDDATDDDGGVGSVDDGDDGRHDN